MKIRHIKKAKDFRQALSLGQRRQGKIFCLYYYKNGETDEPRIGTVVAKRNSVRAVQRNYIRRKIYAEAAKARTALPKGTDIVVRLSAAVSAVEKNELKKLIETDLRQLAKEKK